MVEHGGSCSIEHRTHHRLRHLIEAAQPFSPADNLRARTRCRRRSDEARPGWSELAGRRALVGTVSNNQGVMIKLVALDPYAHWNFKPAAEDMWAFLSRFRRDAVTRGLQVVATP